MAKNCIGLDLGSSAVKVTQVKKKGSGFQLLNFGIEPIPPDTIVDGAILNHSGVVEAVRALFDRLKIKQKEVALAISGNALIINPGEAQIGHKESVEDTAKVLERMVSTIVWRTGAHSGLVAMAENSKVPVINALCDDYHPCQTGPPHGFNLQSG